MVNSKERAPVLKSHEIALHFFRRINIPFRSRNPPFEKSDAVEMPAPEANAWMGIFPQTLEDWAASAETQIPPFLRNIFFEGGANDFGVLGAMGITCDK